MSAEFDFGPDAETRTLAAGDLLCEEGGTDTDVFLIHSGQLDVVRSTDEGEMVVTTVGPGRLVGEVSNAMGGTRSATLRASAPTEVAVLRQDQFLAWLDANPEKEAAIAAQARLRLNRSRAASVLVQLFGLENQQVVDAIVNEIRWTTLAPGDALFEQGDEADAAYLLIAGRIHLLARNDVGDVTLDLEIGRGEIIGEMGIIENAPRSAGARAIRETTLALISRESFGILTAAYPTLLLRVFHTIIDRLIHHHVPDDRARVVGLAVTAPDAPADLLAPMIAAVEPFGSTLHLSAANLGRFVRNIEGAGGQQRVAEFLHESDVAHDYVLLEGDAELTPWSIGVAKQSDRYILLTSANPGAEEKAQIRAHLDELTPVQKASTWIARLHTSRGRPRGSATVLDDFEVAEVHNVSIHDPLHLARLGRLATGNGRGVVLGGGGAKGLAHIGALRALAESGLHYDKIGGASMGSIIGAFACQDRTPSEMLAGSVEAFQTDMMDYTLPLVSIIKAKKLAAALEKQFGDWDITDLWTPFYAVTTNLTTADLAVHRRGCLTTAVRASAAIPVVIPPVPINGELHVDGGVLDNVPVAIMAADNSIGTVIAIDVSPPGGPAAEEDFGLSVSGFEALRNKLSKHRTSRHPDIGLTLMSSMLIGSSKAKSDSIGMVDLYLDLDISGVGLLKFEDHERVAELGYTEALPMIEEWLATQPG
jgi:predicted acylesterase/phospholipase RssA/CRP-like cAMP-binding protein